MSKIFRIKLAMFIAKTGITQKKISQDNNFSQVTINNWKKGRPVRRKNAEKLVAYAPDYFSMKDFGFYEKN